RGPRPRHGTAGLAHALATFREELAKLARGEPCSLHRADPRAALSEADLHAATSLVAQPVTALEPLESLELKTQSFAAIAACHETVLLRLGGMTDELADAFDDIAKADGLELAPDDYPDLFRAAIADRPVRRPEENVRVRIFG